MKSALPLAVGVVLALVVAGCASSPGATYTSDAGLGLSGTTSAQDAASGGTGGTGTFVLKVTDAPDDIGDFTALIIGVSAIRLTGDGVNGSYAPSTYFFDLVQLTNGTTETLFAGEVAAGTYQRLELQVETAVGTLAASGSVVNVTLPGGRLFLNKPFTVAAGQETSFTFDIQVHQLGTGDYQLRPNAAGSFVGDRPPAAQTTSRAPTSRSTTSRATTSRTTTAATTTSGTSSSTTSATSSAPPPPATRLTLWVTADGNLSAFRHLNVTLSAVVVNGPGGNQTSTPAAARLDLARLGNGTVALAWNRTATAGNHTWFELRVAAVAATGFNQTMNATAPGGRLALAERVAVASGGTTHVLLSVQAEKVAAASYALRVDPVASGVIPKPVGNRLV
jgi:hypothetical protein